MDHVTLPQKAVRVSTAGEALQTSLSTALRTVRSVCARRARHGLMCQPLQQLHTLLLSAPTWERVIAALASVAVLQGSRVTPASVRSARTPAPVTASVLVSLKWRLSPMASLLT